MSDTGRNGLPAAESVEFIPGNYFAPIRIGDLFPRPAPLEVDAGCGEGAFLVALAQKNLQRNFLGIERLAGRVRKACRRATRAGLSNVRVLRVESFYALRRLLPAESVSIFHVMFPDPWPKRKHHRRRLVNREFLDAVQVALMPGGELRLTTDDADYFAQMKKIAVGHAGFGEAPWLDDPEYPQTDFEKRFRAQDLPIFRLLLRRRPPVPGGIT